MTSSTETTNTGPQPSAPRAPRRPISVASIEVIIGRAVAVFGVLFGAQALPAALGQRDLVVPVFWMVQVGAVYTLLMVCVVAAIAKRGVKVSNATVATVFLLALALWPFGVEGGQWTSDDRPWLWFMITVATACAAVAFRLTLAAVYLIVVPLLYGTIRLTVFGGTAPVGITLLDVVFATLLGGTILVIITLLRSAAARVDTAQATALSKYLEAVEEHAHDAERVHVDAIVHDTVLSALLSAGRAETAEQREFATNLARNAIVHLKNADAMPRDDDTVLAGVVAQRITLAHERLRTRFDLVFDGIDAEPLPAGIAEAVYSATVQAMVNSSEHAGTCPPVSRSVRMHRREGGGVIVRIADTGVGFIVDEIPAERMGVRVSIVERIAHVGGEARIRSSPGAGAVVEIEWPAPEEST